MKIFFKRVICLFVCLYSCNTRKDIKNEKQNMEMKKDSSFFITDNQNNQHEIFKISSEQFNLMKKENNLTFCNDIYEKYKISAFEFGDGKIIVQESDRYAIYPSIGLLSGILKNYSGPYKSEILYQKNPYGKHFPENDIIIIEKMFHDFNINAEQLNRKDIFIRLDSIVSTNRNEIFLDKYFLGFIALIGKYNIDDFGGKWRMDLADDNETWNPSIEINNQKVNFVDYILEDFYDAKNSTPATEVFETVRDIIRTNIIGVKR